jgi:hypothetical protein
MVDEIDYILFLVPMPQNFFFFDEEVCNTYVGGCQKCYMLYRILRCLGLIPGSLHYRQEFYLDLLP